MTRDNAQASYLTMFAPKDMAGVPAHERAAIAVFTAALHGDDAGTLAFYCAQLTDGRLAAAMTEEAERSAGPGPYGCFPAGPLSREDAPGPVFRIGAESRSILGGRIAAALEHAHMLVLHPRDAAPEAMRRLEREPADIVPG